MGRVGIPKMRELETLMHENSRDPRHARIVANTKRILEKWTLDEDFQKAYRQDPSKALAETGLDVDPEAIRLLLVPNEEDTRTIKAAYAGEISREALPEDYLLYRAFIREKLDMRERLRKELCAPDEPRFKAWRMRQERRCWLEFGPSARCMIQAPLLFELSDGCSVGCPFCAVSAKGLRGVFRHTEEHAALWRGVLSRMHALIGDAAGRGSCYYVSEGFDNPDYEEFLADYFAEFGVVPQTTTAVSTRNVERTRALLRYGNENDPHIDRFSVLSPAMRDTLFESFSPEELLLVELLPQFPEAPDNHLTEAGRNRIGAPEDTVGGTIACASGFVVNMQQKSVRLITPFVSDGAHPTGEWILETCSFSTAEDLEGAVRRMISQHMPERLELGSRCGASCGFRLEEKEGSIWVHGHGMGMDLMDATVGQEALDQLLILLGERERTGYGILNALPEDVDIALVILLLKALWEHGLIDHTEA